MPTQLKEIKPEQKMVEKAMHTIKVNGEQPSKNRDQDCKYWSMDKNECPAYEVKCKK